MADPILESSPDYILLIVTFFSPKKVDKFQLSLKTAATSFVTFLILTDVLMLCSNKLKRFTVCHFGPSLIIPGEAGAHLSEAPYGLYYGRKKFYRTMFLDLLSIGTRAGAKLIKLFTSVIYKCSYQARVFVILVWKSLPKSNTLA
jgi:hypothetical protein